MTLGQKHALTADGIASTPTLGEPILGQKHALTADGVTVGAPVLDEPSIGQKHALTADEVSTTPTVGAPAIEQEHALTADGITTTPVLGTPLLTDVPAGVDALTANGIPSTPVLGTPAIGQIHILLASLTSPSYMRWYGIPTTGTSRSGKAPGASSRQRLSWIRPHRSRPHWIFFRHFSQHRLPSHILERQRPRQPGPLHQSNHLSCPRSAPRPADGFESLLEPAIRFIPLRRDS